MAKPLSQRQTEINKILKLGGKKTLTSNEYFEWQQQNKQNIDASVNIESYEIFNDQNSGTVKCKVYNDVVGVFSGMTTQEIDEKMCLMALTEDFFGFEFENAQQLLFHIADKAYLAGEYYNSNIEQDYYNWQYYCFFVDRIGDFINQNYPDYSKQQKKYRKLIEQNAGLYNFEGFWEDLSSYLDNYSLNQHKQAKIDKLARLGLPNVDAKAAEVITTLYIESLKK